MITMRPTKDQYFLIMAQLVSSRATCLRRAVGCVLVNERGHVLSTGYNGRAMGQQHCNDRLVGNETYPYACKGSASASGTNLDGCEAVHAEQNALLQCRDPWAIDTCYVTVAPCLTCTKLLMNTSCGRIVFVEEYPQKDAAVLWTSGANQRKWLQMMPH